MDTCHGLHGARTGACGRQDPGGAVSHVRGSGAPWPNPNPREDGRSFPMSAPTAIQKSLAEKDRGRRESVTAAPWTCVPTTWWRADAAKVGWRSLEFADGILSRHPHDCGGSALKPIWDLTTWRCSRPRMEENTPVHFGSYGWSGGGRAATSPRAV